MRVQAASAWLTEALERGSQNVEECISVAVNEVGQG